MHNEKKNLSKTDQELTQMLELAKSLKQLL